MTTTSDGTGTLVRRVGPLTATGIALGAIAVTVAVLSLRSPDQIRVGSNVFVTDPGPVNLVTSSNSPTVARDPTDPRRLVVAHRIDRPAFDARLQWSTDGGATWTATELPLPPGLDRPYVPDVSFDAEGTLFVVYANLEGRGNVPDNLWVARSLDSGRTLSEPVRIAGALAFQPRIAVAPDGVVHVTYLQAESVGTLQLVGRARIVMVTSTDGGSTFSDPVAVSDEQRALVGAAVPVAGDDGSLYVLYVDFGEDVRDFRNLEGPVWEEPFSLVLARSFDGGRSFAPGTAVDDDVVPTRRFLVFLPDYPAITAADGALYVAWADGRNGDPDVFLRRSDDGGDSWTDARRVNDTELGDGTAQYLPAVTATGQRVDVAFLDRRRRNDGRATDAYLGSSWDRGRSFLNVRLTSTTFDADIGPTVAPHLEPDLGSRIGVSASDGSAFAVWTDTRLGGGSEEIRQDIVGTTVAVPARRTSGLVPTLLLLASGVALVLLGRHVLRGRSDRAPTDSAAEL